MKHLLTFLFFGIVTVTFGQQSSSQAEKIFADNTTFRNELNEDFADENESPLPLFLLDSFTEIPFYEIDTNYVVRARFEKSTDTTYLSLKTSTERMAAYRIYGHAYFQLNGDSLILNVYQNKQAEEDQLFLPFKDLTNGKETYIAGRYIDIDMPAEGKLVIDFNKAYNPYCAYSNNYSCPLVPVINHLQMAIPAGVKYEKHEEGWNELDASPEYPGGGDELYRQLLSKLKYPKKARKAKKEGAVYIQLIVNRDGSLSDFSVKQGFDPECDEAALNAVKELSAFKPAMKDEKAVRTFIVIPIGFRF